jgi:hypothetical protein
VSEEDTGISKWTKETLLFFFGGGEVVIFSEEIVVEEVAEETAERCVFNLLFEGVEKRKIINKNVKLKIKH